jgi:hypothetical protein
LLNFTIQATLRVSDRLLARCHAETMFFDWNSSLNEFRSNAVFRPVPFDIDFAVAQARELVQSDPNQHPLKDNYPSSYRKSAAIRSVS